MALSLAFHVAIVAVLTWQLGRQAAPPEAPVINVRLVTLAPRKPAEPRKAERREQRPLAVRTPRAAPPPTVAAAPIAPTPALAADPAAGVSRTLRRAVGCEHADLMRLSPEERERCRERAVADAKTPDRRLNLDPTGRYAENPEPYLQQRPTKGCKPRAGGSVDPMGKHGAAAGVTCVIPF